MLLREADPPEKIDQEMEHDHSPEAIRERLAGGPHHNYLRDWVYGGIDGAVTTFAIVSGVVGAQLSPTIIIVMGLANVVADGFSMASSNYLGTKAEHDDIARVKAIEGRHIDLAPEGEREEVRQIFRKKGFDGDDLERVVALITADRARWIATMLTEEYGLPRDARSPWIAAISTFTAFLICGLTPLVPFIFGARQGFWLSALLTGAVFFTIGSVKSRWSTTSWLNSGLSTLVVGSTAAALAFVMGVLLKHLAH